MLNQFPSFKAHIRPLERRPRKNSRQFVRIVIQNFKKENAQTSTFFIQYSTNRKKLHFVISVGTRKINFILYNCIVTWLIGIF